MDSREKPVCPAKFGSDEVARASGSTLVTVQAGTKQMRAIAIAMAWSHRLVSIDMASVVNVRGQLTARRLRPVVRIFSMFSGV